jgi:CRISPR system Cascade subunit CasB
MNQDESPSVPVSTAVAPTVTDVPALARSSPIGLLAGFVDRAGIGERAALARLNPEQLLPHQIAALSRGLIHAGLDPDQWRSSTWARWALIANGMALAGHDSKGPLGEQLANAGVSESRVTKLLTSRGDAFAQIVPRLLRLMASKGVKPNWHELGRLILAEQSNDRTAQEDAETLRVRIAGKYFSTQARRNKVAA